MPRKACPSGSREPTILTAMWADVPFSAGLVVSAARLRRDGIHWRGVNRGVAVATSENVLAPVEFEQRLATPGRRIAATNDDRLVPTSGRPEPSADQFV
jgi:hypothetical protein